MPTPFIDLHLHVEGLSDQDLETLAFFGMAGALTCASGAGAVRSEEIRAHWQDLLEVQTARLGAAGIRPWVALGLHPSRIPWHGVEALLHELPSLFGDPRVAALGELGLEQGTPREEEMLARQLELAARLGRPSLLHTPREGKLTQTRRLLSLLRELGTPEDEVLLDHLDAETLPLVRGCGFWAGLTLQPGALELPQAVALLARAGPAGIVLTSDAGQGACDLLALPRALDALAAAGVSADARRALVYEHPLAFLRQRAV